MSPLSRRKALQFGGVVFASGIAGCTVLRGDDDVPTGRLVELFVTNLDSKPHSVGVLMQRAGEPVYHNSMLATAYDADAEKAGGGGFEGYPGKPGRYDVYAWYDAQPVEQWRHYEFKSPPGSDEGTVEGQCIRLHLKLGSRHNQSDPPTLDILTGDSC